MPSGWIANPDDASYPPAPWHLGGTLLVSAWWVPVAALPASLPPQARPVSCFGHSIVVTAWAIYEPGGVLAYNEVMAAVRVRMGRKRCITITHIWVDHPSSVAGARALWGIPKKLAVFQAIHGGRGAPFEADAESDGQCIASVDFQPRLALPGWWRLRTQTAQSLDGQVKIARAQALAQVELGAAAWRFAPAGPLGFLDRRKPLLSIRLNPISVSFGI